MQYVSHLEAFSPCIVKLGSSTSLPSNFQHHVVKCTQDVDNVISDRNAGRAAAAAVVPATINKDSIDTNASSNLVHGAPAAHGRHRGQTHRSSCQDVAHS